MTGHRRRRVGLRDYEEAMVECGVSSRLLWNAQLRAQLHQQKEGALLGCRLPLGGQWEQGKGDWTWKQEMRSEAQPWVRTLCVSNHCFSSRRHEGKQQISPVAILFGLNKMRFESVL